MKTMYVLCSNDYPDSVFDTEEEAEAWRKVLNRPDHGIFVHVKTCIVGEPSEWLRRRIEDKDRYEAAKEAR